MNLLSYYKEAGSSGEKSRILVVYALLGTAFFMPLNLIAMEVCFIVALLLGVRCLLTENLGLWQSSPFCKPVVAFAFIALLSLAGSPKPLFGIAFYGFTILQYVLLFFMILVFIRHERERKMLVKALLYSTVIVVLYGLYQYVHMLTLHEVEWVDNEAFPRLMRRMYSTLYNPNLLSEFLLFMISATASLCIAKIPKWKQAVPYGALLGGLVLCLILTYSRGAWLSLCAIVFFFGLVWDKRLWLSFSVIPFILLFYHGGVTTRLMSIFSHSEVDTSVSMRIDMWTGAWQMFLDHPGLGVGWGAFKFVYPAYNELIQQAGITIFHAHNMYLNILAETGLIGFLLFMGILVYTCVYAGRFLIGHEGTPFDRALAMTVVAAILGADVSGVTDYDLFSTQISLTLWLFIALFVNMCGEYHKKCGKSLRNNSQ